MSTKSTTAGKPSSHKSYLKLIEAFPLHAIRNDAHLVASRKVLEKLLACRALDEGQVDYVNALTDLIEAYESRNVVIEPTDDATVVKHLMSARKVLQKDVAEGTGIAKTTISQIINGSRRPTRDQIVSLAKYFRISPAVFLHVE